MKAKLSEKRIFGKFFINWDVGCHHLDTEGEKTLDHRPFPMSQCVYAYMRTSVYASMRYYAEHQIVHFHHRVIEVAETSCGIFSCMKSLFYTQVTVILRITSGPLKLRGESVMPSRTSHGGWPQTFS